MKPILRWQYEQITKGLLLIQGHGSSIECPCSSEGEMCLRKHYLELEALCEETSPICDDEEMKQKLFDLTKEARALRADEELELCGKEGQLDTDIADWARGWRKEFEQACLVCELTPAEEALVEEVAEMFRKKVEPRWCHPVKETDQELSKLSRTLGTAKKRIAVIQRSLEMPLNICRGQAEMFETPTGVLDPYGSRCRDQKTGQWVYSEDCGYEPAGITTTALGMDGLTRYEFEFKIVSLDKLIVSHDPFTFTPNPKYPKELQPRLRERAATKVQVEKIAANLEPDAVITDFHVIDRGTPIVGPDFVVEAGNGRVMGIIRAAADHPGKYSNYKDRLRERTHDYGLSPKDIDSIENPVLVRVRISDVDRTTFAQEANQAATIAPSAIENARTDAQKITLGMLRELAVGENESLEDALRAPKNQAFAKRFLATLPENVQAALVDAQGYLNRDGVHRMAMGIFVSAFQGDPGLRLAEKAFESVDMDVRNTVNAIARSLGTMAQAEALTRTGERDTALSIGDDLAQTINVYSAIKRNPALTVAKYLDQEQMFTRELTPFQESILVVLDEYKRAPKKLAGIFTAYAEGVIAAPPPAQGALIPGAEITKEGLWESAVKAPELQPVLMEVVRMFEKAGGDKAVYIKRLLAFELCAGSIAGKPDVLARAKFYAKKKIEELEEIDRHYRGGALARDRELDAIALQALGRRVPSYLQEENISQEILEAPMKLLTKEIRKKLPALYSQSEVPDPMVQVKFFTPDSNWTWYATEFDGKDTFFGWVVGFEKELGYFSLSELESARGPMNLAIERDKWFKPMPLSEVKKLHQHEHGEMGQSDKEILDGFIGQKLKGFSAAGVLWEAKVLSWAKAEDLGEGYYELTLDNGNTVANLLFYLRNFVEASNEAKLAQGTMAAIGAAAITGVGIGAGFKFVDWVANKFSKRELKEGEIGEKYEPLAPQNMERIESDLKFLREKIDDRMTSPDMRTWYSGQWHALTDLVWWSGRRDDTRPFVDWQEQFKPTKLSDIHPDQAKMGAAHPVPKEIVFYSTTIEKHYLSEADIHPGSIRAVKSVKGEPNVLVYLCCEKGHKWDSEKSICSPNPSVYKTIVPRTKKYEDEAEDWIRAYPEAKVTRTKEVGIEPVVAEEDREELEAVGQALENAKEVA